MQRKQSHDRQRQRGGAVLVEAAITVPIFLIFVFGMIDLGIGVQRRNMTAEAARIGARQAIVHGTDAAKLGTWDKAAAEAGIRAELEPLMAAAAIGATDFHVTVTYTDTSGDGFNAPGSTVAVKVEVDYQHLVPFLGYGSTTVVAESSMIISN